MAYWQRRKRVRYGRRYLSNRRLGMYATFKYSRVPFGSRELGDAIYRLRSPPINPSYRELYSPIKTRKVFKKKAKKLSKASATPDRFPTPLQPPLLDTARQRAWERFVGDNRAAPPRAEEIAPRRFTWKEAVSDVAREYKKLRERQSS